MRSAPKTHRKKRELERFTKEFIFYTQVVFHSCFFEFTESGVDAAAFAILQSIRRDLHTSLPVKTDLLLRFNRIEQESRRIMNEIDHLWIVICACFVFFMQAGFICYEVGFVRPKNVVSVAIENIIAFVIATLAFCFIGFAFMFGKRISA